MKHLLCAAFFALFFVVSSSSSYAEERGSFERAGDYGALALPALAGVCAWRQKRLGQFFTGLATQAIVVETLKKTTGSHAINRRPHGGENGIVSGHVAAATYGAANIAHKCVPDKPLIGAIAYGTAVAVAASRMDANKHSGLQAFGGALIGYYSNGVTLSAGNRGFGINFSLDF